MSASASYPAWELEHRYGPRVHLLGDVWTRSALARIGSPSIGQTELLALVREVYTHLVRSICHELPTVEASVPTRMAEAHPDSGVWHGRVLDPAARIVIVDVIRGGILASQVCFESLLGVLPVESLRLDHINLARTSDDAGRVTGVDLTGSKIGGTLVGSTLILPDPMGATGSTVIRAIEHLVEGFGQPARILVLPMICTPEFLRAVLDFRDDIVVYAGRLDRGLSDADVLEAVPGSAWERERGLDERGYIVPGAGGVGEVLNNSWC
ncbi:MAG: uracil phosphoribosyltransferase [bacterium]|nr:uracil phosphoribosyltransferase [bacterium]